MLDGHQNGPAPLAADSDPLEEAQYHKHDRRPDVNRGVHRQQPDQEGGGARNQERVNQHELAPLAVAQVAADDPSLNSRSSGAR